MATSAVSKEVVVEVDQNAIEGGVIHLEITKIWGSIDIKHRGSNLGGGMTWVPEGRLTVEFPLGEESDGISIDQTTELFQDLLQAMMPTVKMFVRTIDGSDDDF